MSSFYIQYVVDDKDIDFGKKIYKSIRLAHLKKLAHLIFFTNFNYFPLSAVLIFAAGSYEEPTRREDPDSSRPISIYELLAIGTITSKQTTLNLSYLYSSGITFNIFPIVNSVK